jgi:hypothetical protein
MRRIGIRIGSSQQVCRDSTTAGTLAQSKRLELPKRKSQHEEHDEPRRAQRGFDEEQPPRSLCWSFRQAACRLGIGFASVNETWIPRRRFDEFTDFSQAFIIDSGYSSV